ncbi:hypothetical protein, partial [Dickeya oryzae]
VFPTERLGAESDLSGDTVGIKKNGVCRSRTWRLAMSRFIIEFGDSPERSPLNRVAITQNYVHPQHYNSLHFCLFFLNVDIVSV